MIVRILPAPSRRPGAVALGIAGAALLMAPGTSAAGTPVTVPPVPTTTVAPVVSAPGPVSGEYSLAAAMANRSSALEDAHADMRLVVDLDGQALTVVLGSDFDAETGRMKAAVTVDGLPSDLGSLLPGLSGPAAVEPLPPGSEVTLPPQTVPPVPTLPAIPSSSSVVPGSQSLSLDLLLDYQTAKLYVDTAKLPIPLGSTKRFVAVDLTSMGGADVQKQLSSVLDGSALTKALDVSTAVDQGRVTLDGEEVEKYQLTVDLAKAMADNPQLEGQIDSSVGDVPTSVPITIYVTRDNRIRGLDLTISQEQGTVTAEIRMPDLAGPIDITLPDPGEVEALPDLSGLPGLPGLNPTLTTIFPDGPLPPDVVGTLVPATTTG